MDVPRERWAATAWVQEVLEAYVCDQSSVASKFLRQAERWQVDKLDVTVSGALFVLEAKELWVKLPDNLQSRRAGIIKTWRALKGDASKSRRPMGGCTPTDAG